MTANDETVWLFGYGSLIFKTDFVYEAAAPASILHWSRKFWQASIDHRGTHHFPGRVTTLIEDVNNRCYGMAYRISRDVLDHLDHRERNGYERIDVELLMDGKGLSGQPAQWSQPGIVYIAGPDNPSYIGPEDEAVIASVIARAEGESGPNTEYLYKLARALREMEIDDIHVFEIEQHLVQLASPASEP